MSQLITASEAKKQSSDNVKTPLYYEILKQINSHFSMAIKNGKFNTTFTYSTLIRNSMIDLIIKELESFGYKVKETYIEPSNCVNIFWN